MNDKKLTVIIPFLNEKYEVENTLESIRSHSNNDIDIILINDASDDIFDYRQVAEKYGAVYIQNQERLGVAASRDLGVELCQTPFFLFLDAHMRFYDNLWVQRIVHELEKDNRTLLCGQTKVLKIDRGILLDCSVSRRNGSGACVELEDGYRAMEANWVFNIPFDTEETDTISIVCVLGAVYACSKEYWQYLKGLEGLRYYGNDEAYISIKVWLEGGTCKLLKDVVVGHIYRSTKIPYTNDLKDRLYNRFFLVELFCPERLKKKLISKAKLINASAISEVLLMLHENRMMISLLKNYYNSIFTRDFSFFESMNNEYRKLNSEETAVVGGKDNILKNIADLLIKTQTDDIGIIRGKMGTVIFLFHYSRYIDEEFYRMEAEKMLENLLTDIPPDLHYGFSTGICGIGWGVEYLYQHGFVEGDTNEILEDFDNKIMEIDPSRITNLSGGHGFGGIVRYLLARLYSIQSEEKKNPFDKKYLSGVFKRVSSIIQEKDSSSDCIDFFLDFRNYVECSKKIVKPEIYDAWCLADVGNTFLQDMSPGLKGKAGIGLQLIFEHEELQTNCK